jgi:hypothetical protein
MLSARCDADTLNATQCELAGNLSTAESGGIARSTAMHAPLQQFCKVRVLSEAARKACKTLHRAEWARIRRTGLKQAGLVAPHVAQRLAA